MYSNTVQYCKFKNFDISIVLIQFALNAVSLFLYITVNLLYILFYSLLF